VAGGLKEELSVTAGEADAFSQLVENARRPRPKPEFGGGALERRSISEQVANRILSMIKSGNLKSGDRLPTEAQMGIAFSISRPPLREAEKGELNLLEPCIPDDSALRAGPFKSRSTHELG
jgi:hypothetical protein